MFCIKKRRIKLLVAAKNSSGFNQLNNFAKGNINAVRYSTGFTLIELTLAILLVGVFAVVAIPQLYELKSQLSLSMAAHRFAQDLRKVQDRSISSVQLKDETGSLLSVGGYGIYVTLSGSGNTQYLLYADRSPGNQQYDQDDYVLETVNFDAIERGVIISGIVNTDTQEVSINFAPPRPNVAIWNMSAGQSNVQVVFAFSGNASQTKKVLINTSGFIEVQ